MNCRTISSKVFGNLGQFQAVGKNLYRSESGRIHLLGKNEGLLFLDQARDEIGVYQVPHTLVVCDDYFNLPVQSVKHPQEIQGLNRTKIALLIKILSDLGFPTAVAIRSSAIIEDQIGRAGAGKFKTDYATWDYLTHLEIEGFANKLRGVLNSTYGGEGLELFQKSGCQAIPPMPIAVQDLVGDNWEDHPSLFFPPLAGIINTSFVHKVKVNAVLGFGLSAVQDEGMGVTIIFNDRTLLDSMLEGPANLNSLLYYFDLVKGQMKEVFIPDSFSEVFRSELYRLWREEFRSSREDVVLANLALLLEERAGAPLDIEWAWLRNGERYFLQARPLKRRKLIPRPAIGQEKIMLESDSVIGQDLGSYSHIVVVRSGGSSLSEDEGQLIKEACEAYPNCLIVFKSKIEKNQGKRSIRKFILPYANAVLVVDEKEHGKSGGSGLQHLALNCIDEEKAIVHTEDASIVWRLEEISKLRETKIMDKKDVEISAYELPQPLHLAANDEDGWGLLYV